MCCALDIRFVLNDLGVVVNLHTGTCGKELTDDNVLLKTQQMVGLALDGSIGQGTCSPPKGSSPSWRMPL